VTAVHLLPGRLHLGVGPCGLRFTYVTPVLVKKYKVLVLQVSRLMDTIFLATSAPLRADEQGDDPSSKYVPPSVLTD
jgi:hypothetical protein